MKMTDLEQAAERARLLRDLRRRAQIAETDLAETVVDLLDTGVQLDEIARAADMDAEDITALVKRESKRISNRRSRRRRAADIKAGRIQPRHGTSEAVSTGCRCELCEEQRQRYRQARAAERRQGLPPDHPDHGTWQGANRWGCRCAECKTAASLYRARWRHEQLAKARARDREYYRRRRDRMTPEELEEVRRRDRERWAVRSKRRAVGSSEPLGSWSPIVDAPPAQWRELRKRAGVTMTELARHLQVDAAVLSRWETGKHHPEEQSRRRYLAGLDEIARRKTEGKTTP